jgi:propionyl-CoA synthetase
MISNFKNLEHFKFKPGSATKPVPGFKFHIVDETTGKPSKAGEKGLVYVKLPTPPSFMLGLWKND